MRVIAHRDGLFGRIRVLKRKSDGARLYCIGSSSRTMATADGTSPFGYVHAIELLLGETPNILMIGGAGGTHGEPLSIANASPDSAGHAAYGANPCLLATAIIWHHVHATSNAAGKVSQSNDWSGQSRRWSESSKSI